MKKAILIINLVLFCTTGFSQSEGFRSPLEIQFSPDGKTLAVSDFTKGSVYFIDAESKTVKKEMLNFDRPFGIAWQDNNRLAVSEYGAHQLSIINHQNYSTVKGISTVKYPMGIAKSSEYELLVCGFGKSELGKINTLSGTQIATIPLWYQPDFVAVSPDKKTAVVSNLTPKSSAAGAKISVVDLVDNSTQHIELLLGATNVRQITIAPDGKWAYVVHTYGKVMLPTTQIEKGWVNTNVFSIIDLENKSLYATLPFDFTIRGGADPWGLAVSKDGSKLFATLAGANELAMVHLDLLHQYLAGEQKPEDLRNSDANAQIASGIWEKIYKNPSDRMLLADQFSALYAAGLLQRFKLPITHPRGIAFSHDEKSLIIGGYYSGEILWFDLKTYEVSTVLKLGNEPELTLERRGEMLFHDATGTFQGWLSCVSCHPAGRADGLNWDLLNDGIGNPKNAKSLLLSHATPPSMSTGIRENYEVAVYAGFHHIKFVEPAKEDANAIMAYLSSMKPDASPYLNNEGELTASAKQGKVLFESEEVGCIKCHKGPLLTDMELHNVGTKTKYDRTENFDTPTLIEAWRTAPYLHSGEAESLEELFAPGNPRRHKLGKTKHLKTEELKALIEYVKSL